MSWLIENVFKPWHPTILGIMVITALLYFGLPPTRPAPSKSPEEDTAEGLKYSDFGKIEIGMTEEEVERILGVPGKERTPWGEKEPARTFMKEWYVKGYRVQLFFDENHRYTMMDVWLDGC